MKPEMTDLTTLLPAVGSNGRRELRNLKQIVVHHSGHIIGNSQDAFTHLKAFANYHIGRGWKRLSYHYAIARDGTIYFCSPMEEITYHAGNYWVNRTGIGIMLLGNFEMQEPTNPQKESLIHLLDWLCFERPEIPKMVKSQVLGHREVRIPPWSTLCPGKTLFSLVRAYRGG